MILTNICNVRSSSAPLNSQFNKVSGKKILSLNYVHLPLHKRLNLMNSLLLSFQFISPSIDLQTFYLAND